MKPSHARHGRQRAPSGREFVALRLASRAIFSDNAAIPRDGAIVFGDLAGHLDASLFWAGRHAGPIFSRTRCGMPGDGATTFGDLVGRREELRVECDKCGRAGR